MLLHIALIMETLAAIICIYDIYGEKFRLDKKTLGAFLSILIILEIINGNDLSSIFTFGVYIIYFTYCKTRFKSSMTETMISLVLCIVLVTLTQFMCALFVSTLQIDIEYVEYVVTNMMSLAVFIVLSSTNGLYRLKKSMCRYSRFVVISFLFIGTMIIVILLQGKWFNEVQTQYFLFSIPTIVMLLYVIVKWYTAQSETEKMQERICEIEGNKKNYENLLTKVRLRQHALKNHMEAIASFHYTYKMAENLVQIEEDYCNQLRKENKYNDLLLIGDDVLTGYLCGKFQAAEDDGIEIDYRITSEISQCRVPIYHVIEMLGILFDNAVEAVKEMDGKAIFFSASMVDDKYEFVVRNQFPYVPYDEIEDWFGFEKSGKGSGRGLGLYHLKCLCREWNCEIQCRNMELSGKNWIVFSLRIEKKETDSI